MGLKLWCYVVSAKGGKASLVTKQGSQPHFGDRSDRIYLTRNGEKTQLVRIDLDGQHEKKLYQGKVATEYRVSPNGEYLALLSALMFLLRH